MSKHGTPGSNGAQCENCVKKRHRGHKDARDDKYCSNHQCPVKKHGGIVCTERKKRPDRRCGSHSTCEFKYCSRPRLSDESGIPNEFCIEHACVVWVDGCAEGNVYNATGNVHGDLCASHALRICSLPACPNWKADGKFCQLHSCNIDSCSERVVGEDQPFCTDHSKCTIPQCAAEKLLQVDRFEDVCREHYTASCRLCPNKSQKHSQYCVLHSCRYQRCSADARPSLGRPYCVQHRCHNKDCHSLPNFGEVDGDLSINTYCVHHECQNSKCMNHSAPGKSYCSSHCCTNSICTQNRDGDPRFGTLCLHHHEEKIKQKARDKVLEDMAAQQRLDDETRRHHRNPRSYYHTSRQEYPTNSYAEDEYDEGYRSNRNSDSYQPRSGGRRR